MEAMKCWTAYDSCMNELIINYVKLMYLVQFSKKEALHRIIKAAAVNCSPQISATLNSYNSTNSLRYG
jgi:hypothetical protein